MCWRMAAVTVATAALLCGPTPGRCDVESAVRVLSKFNKQLVTSSTLLWLEAHDGAIPEHAVPSNADVLVCRVLADGMWVPGGLRGGACVASMHGRVYRSRDYQVLQNVEGGGRLGWQPWDRFHEVKPGTVAASAEPDVAYVARRGPDLVGKLDPSLSLLGKIVVAEPDGAEHDYEEGEVLVETEPVRYEMDDVVLQEWRARARRERLTLGSATLHNADPPRTDAPASRVDVVITYRHNTTVGWGHGHAVLTGLPVSVRLRDGQPLAAFRWAVDNVTDGQATYPVEALLPPGQACNVTLLGNWTESNVPYEARLTAVYEDGERLTRTLVGVRREIGLRDVRPIFGPLYYMADGTLVPTTSTTTTTTTSTPAPSSTTADTTTTTTARPITSSLVPDSIKKRPAGSANGTEMQADGPGAVRESGSGAGGGAWARTLPAVNALALAAAVALACGT